jgi:hypothetical protein
MGVDNGMLDPREGIYRGGGVGWEEAARTWTRVVVSGS